VVDAAVVDAAVVDAAVVDAAVVDAVVAAVVVGPARPARSTALAARGSAAWARMRMVRMSSQDVRGRGS
jgi:hypothetical protein